MVLRDIEKGVRLPHHIPNPSRGPHRDPSLDRIVVQPQTPTLRHLVPITNRMGAQLPPRHRNLGRIATMSGQQGELQSHIGLPLQRRNHLSTPPTTRRPESSLTLTQVRPFRLAGSAPPRPKAEGGKQVFLSLGRSPGEMLRNETEGAIEQGPEIDVTYPPALKQLPDHDHRHSSTHRDPRRVAVHLPRRPLRCSRRHPHRPEGPVTNPVVRPAAIKAGCGVS